MPSLSIPGPCPGPLLCGRRSSFLIHDIRLDDSLDLIAMASDRQWDYIFDIESWTKDRIDLPAVTQWMALMIKADSRRFIRWAITERPNLVEYFLFHALEVIVREHDQDPSDFGDGFNTYDDVYYFRIPENNYAQDVEPDFKSPPPGEVLDLNNRPHSRNGSCFFNRPCSGRVRHPGGKRRRSLSFAQFPSGRKRISPVS
ncbi:MAG: DUF6178 family protein [Desulfobacterales bacterium]